MGGNECSFWKRFLYILLFFTEFARKWIFIQKTEYFSQKIRQNKQKLPFFA